RQFGIEVERQTELTEFIEERGAIAARLRKADGSSELCKAKYLAGCDGARSLVRESLKLGFPGGTYHHVFYVADVEGSGAAIDGELHIDLDDADFLAVFPLAGAGRARFVGSTRDVSPEDSAKLSFADINKRAIEQLKLAVDKVNWFSTYHVHHRVVDHFRQGRAFLLGDAAHIHSPVGGQGMNTGIGDAINLAWKLAATLAGKAPDSLLDSYEAERIAFARRLVATTDRVFNVVSSDGKLAGLVRTRIAPAVLGSLISIGFVRNLLFRLVSQIELNYRGRPLSLGRAGDVHGGDRLAWVKTADGDNHAPLSAMRWQAHIYGVAGGALVAWCKDRGLPLHVFAWRPEYAKAGLAHNALYLMRPDGYVALAEATADPTVLERYLTERGLRID
ncbi:MAG: FAD-dependent oxidoreductase, partial [Bradyrhizobium sp.]